MQTIELFSGTGSFSKVAAKAGHKTFTVDNDTSHNPDLVADVTRLKINSLPYQPDILWCSPPCEAFSIASVGHHWNRDRTPKSANAFKALLIVKSMVRIIDELQPAWVFIENPRGMLRKFPFLDHLRRETITYCQYGDTRMKRTDIWTNVDWWQPRPACKNGAPCHEAAPRGSKSGTQGLKGAKERGRIPPALFTEIFDQLAEFEQEQEQSAAISDAVQQPNAQWEEAA